MEDFMRLKKSDVEELLESHAELLINDDLADALLDIIEEQEILQQNNP